MSKTTKTNTQELERPRKSIGGIRKREGGGGSKEGGGKETDLGVQFKNRLLRPYQQTKGNHRRKKFGKRGGVNGLTGQHPIMCRFCGKGKERKKKPPTRGLRGDYSISESIFAKKKGTKKTYRGCGFRREGGQRS